MPVNTSHAHTKWHKPRKLPTTNPNLYLLIMGSPFLVLFRFNRSSPKSPGSGDGVRHSSHISQELGATGSPSISPSSSFVNYSAAATRCKGSRCAQILLYVFTTSAYAISHG